MSKKLGGTMKGGKRMRKKLIEIRKKKHLTQDELATLSGTSRPTITSLEAGRFSPSFEVSVRIKKSLDYYDDDLFFNEEGE